MFEHRCAVDLDLGSQLTDGDSEFVLFDQLLDLVVSESELAFVMR